MDAPSIAFFAMVGYNEAHTGLPLQHEVAARVSHLRPGKL